MNWCCGTLKCQVVCSQKHPIEFNRALKWLEHAWIPFNFSCSFVGSKKSCYILYHSFTLMMGNPHMETWKIMLIHVGHLSVALVEGPSDYPFFVLTKTQRSFRHWHRLHEPDSKESRDLAKVYDLAVLPKAKLDDWKKLFPFAKTKTNTRLETNTAPIRGRFPIGISFSRDAFSGAILVSGRYYNI